MSKLLSIQSEKLRMLGFNGNLQRDIMDGNIDFKDLPLSVDKPENSATDGATFGDNISGGGTGDGQVGNSGYISKLNVNKLIAGTITSKEITMAVTPAEGDTKIQAGKNDFYNTRLLGGVSTRFDVAQQGATITYRYTWDGTGTDPVINTTTVRIGDYITIFSTDLSLGNRGEFVVTGSGTNYFEVTNAVGDTETDKTLANGKLEISQNGFIIGIDDSDSDTAKFHIGTNQRYFSWDGTNIKTRGSIERNDFHWFTLFESIDGYIASGNVAPILTSDYVSILTDAISGHTSQLQKILLYHSSEFTWDKDRKLRTAINFISEGNQTIKIATGGAHTNADKKIGFLISNTIIYGVTGDGTDYNAVEIDTIVAGANRILEARFFAGSRCEFYVNGILKGMSWANLPSGTGSGEDHFLEIYVTADENAAKGVRCSYWDLWQQY